MQNQIHYRLPTRINTSYPGFHDSRIMGNGFEFKEYCTLLRSSDPRRIDLRASINNPFNDILVRVFNQQSEISVIVIADLSISMRCPNPEGKLKYLAKFVRLLGSSVAQRGDKFGFIGFDNTIHNDFIWPASKYSNVDTIASKLDLFTPDTPCADGLLQADLYLGSKPALVFLASDFFLPERLLKETLIRLKRHYLVPLLFTHPSETQGPKGLGLLRVKDSESTRHRMLFLRPSLRNKIQYKYYLHQKKLVSICTKIGISPLILSPNFTSQDVNQYFYQYGLQS